MGIARWRSAGSMEHAVLSAARSRQPKSAGSDRRAGVAFRAFPDLVLAAHRAPRRAGGGEPRAEGDRRYPEEPRSYRGSRSRLVRGPPDRGLEARPPPACRCQPARHAGLRGRTIAGARMTWSIIARDDATGQFGIAVATRFFAVGARVPHIAAGIGGIATEALGNPYYGIDGGKLFREGREHPGVVCN